MSVPEHWLANQMEPWNSLAVRNYADAYALKHAEKVEAENKRLQTNLLIDVGVLNKMTAENATLAAQVGYARKELVALRAAARAYMDAECGEGSITATLDALAALLDGQPQALKDE